jgi:hypothetical protein
MQLHTVIPLRQGRRVILSRSLIAVITFFLFSPTLGWTQENQALQQEINALKEGQHAIQKDLQEIKTLLRSLQRGAAAPAVPQNVVLDLEQAQMKGEQTTKLVLVEFTDYQ